MRIGPRTRNQLSRLASVWKQGDHVVISGETGSGKTMLGRYLEEIRLRRKGYLVVFVAKLAPDETILNEYKGFRRWTEWDLKNRRDDRRVLLWPDVSKAKDIKEMRAIQRKVFLDAMNDIARPNRGYWTVDFDEGLYMCDPKFMNLDDEIAMLHALNRTNKTTLITKMQRPSNVPLIVYGSASHAFVGRTSEDSDIRRLSNMGGKYSSKEIREMMKPLGRHDFLWIPRGPDWEPEVVNLER